MPNLATLLTVYKAKGFDIVNVAEIKSGKEATVYYAEAGGKAYALKVYKDPEQRAFQKNHAYLEGKFHKEHSVRRAIAKGNAFSKKHLHTSWVKREFDVLRKLNELGAAVPQVYDWAEGSILMEFVGDERVPAPRLIDVDMLPSEAMPTFDALVETIHLFLKVGIVHADLSPYNILWWKEKPFVIDFPQAIDARHNPNKDALLKRDIKNVIGYFKRYREINENEIYVRLGVDPL